MTETKEQIEQRRADFVAGWHEHAERCGAICRGVAERRAVERYPAPRVPRVIRLGIADFRVVNGLVECRSSLGNDWGRSGFTAEIVHQLVDLIANPYEP